MPPDLLQVGQIVGAVSVGKVRDGIRQPGEDCLLRAVSSISSASRIRCGVARPYRSTARKNQDIVGVYSMGVLIEVYCKVLSRILRAVEAKG